MASEMYERARSDVDSRSSCFHFFPAEHNYTNWKPSARVRSLPFRVPL
jgi:cation diffusion facilitator CzcD-associated flavoprotein CzcO